MTTANTISPWICSACRKRIAGDSGIIRLSDPVTDGTPRYASPDHPPGHSEEAEVVLREVGTRQEWREARIGGALWLLDRKPNVAIQVLHGHCCPDGDPGYVIALARAHTLEQWVAWVLHLQENTWIGQWDTLRLLSFWWEGRNLREPSVLA